MKRRVHVRGRSEAASVASRHLASTSGAPCRQPSQPDIGRLNGVSHICVTPSGMTGTINGQFPAVKSEASPSGLDRRKYNLVLPPDNFLANCRYFVPTLFCSEFVVTVNGSCPVCYLASRDTCVMLGDRDGRVADC